MKAKMKAYDVKKKAGEVKSEAMNEIHQKRV